MTSQLDDFQSIAIGFLSYINNLCIFRIELRHNTRKTVFCHLFYCALWEKSSIFNYLSTLCIFFALCLLLMKRYLSHITLEIRINCFSSQEQQYKRNVNVYLSLIHPRFLPFPRNGYFSIEFKLGDPSMVEFFFFISLSGFWHQRWKNNRFFIFHLIS